MNEGGALVNRKHLEMGINLLKRRLGHLQDKVEARFSWLTDQHELRTSSDERAFKLKQLRKFEDNEQQRKSREKQALQEAAESAQHGAEKLSNPNDRGGGARANSDNVEKLRRRLEKLGVKRPVRKASDDHSEAPVSSSSSSSNHHHNHNHNQNHNHKHSHHSMLRDVSTVSLSTTLDYIRQGQHKGSKRGRNKKKGLMKYSAAVHNPAYNNHRGMMRTRSEADMHIYHHSSGKKGKSKRRKQGRHVEDIIYTLDFPPAIDLDLHKHCFEAMKHVRVSKKHASYFEHFTFCHESEEIVKKLFWFTFCTYFQKNGEYERDKLIQQVSQEYTKLIYQLMTPPKRFDKYERPVYDIQFKKRKEQAIAISVSKDKFMQAYPFLLASIIFDIYCSVFPGSLNLFDNDFLQRLEYDYNLLLAGVKLAKTTLTKMRERVFPDSVMHVDDDMAANSLHVAHSRLPARHQHHHKQHLHSSKFDGGPGNDGETKGRNDGGNTNENDNSSESEDEHELQLDASGNPASIGGERKAARGEGDKSLSRSLSRSSVPIERQIKADVEHASRSQTPFEMIKQRENKDKRYRQKHMRMRPRKVSFNTNLLTPVMQRGLGQSTASRLWQSSRKVSHVMPLDDSLLGGENTFTPFVPQEYMAKSDLLIEQCNEVRRHAQHLPGFPFQRGKSKNDKRMNKSKSTGFLLSSSSSSSMGRKNNKHRYSVSSLHHHQGPKGKLSRSSSRRSIMGKNIGISPLVNDDNPLMESLNNSVDMSELNEFTHGGGGGIHDDQF